jgi:hypothetical protein
MNLQLDNRRQRNLAEHRNHWSDNRMWWINCLAVERFWFYGGADLQAARARRDTILASVLENMARA